MDLHFWDDTCTEAVASTATTTITATATPSAVVIIIIAPDGTWDTPF